MVYTPSSGKESLVAASLMGLPTEDGTSHYKDLPPLQFEVSNNCGDDTVQELDFSCVGVRRTKREMSRVLEEVEMASRGFDVPEGKVIADMRVWSSAISDQFVSKCCQSDLRAADTGRVYGHHQLLFAFECTECHKIVKLGSRDRVRLKRPQSAIVDVDDEEVVEADQEEPTRPGSYDVSVVQTVLSCVCCASSACPTSCTFWSIDTAG
jgi:hypothetical protein